MDSIREIYKYSKDFGISLEEIKSSIRETSLKTGHTQKHISEIILNHIETLIYGCIKQSEEHGMKLKSYQILAVNHMLKNRGMIAAFSTGVGKTLVSVAVANCILNLSKFIGKEIKVIVVTPTSLQENFKKEMVAYGSNPNDPRYFFYTTAKFGIEYKKGNIDCEKTLFIVDEAHVFRTDYRELFMAGPPRETEKNTTRAEFGLMCASKAWKVLLLTATPIYNRTYNLVNLASMVKGVYPPYDKDPYELMIEDPKLFKSQYSNTILFQNSSKVNYPEQENILVKVVMTPSYLEKYLNFEEIIDEELARNEGREEPTTNAFMVKIRRASNKLKECIKCDEVIKIIKNGKKIVFYSEFKSYGIEIIKNILDEERIGYYVISGSVSMKKRSDIVKDFNSYHGNKVLIITKAGGEGLNLKEVSDVILFEPGWNFSGDQQVLGRAIRYKSHEFLPVKEQKVRVWHIICVKPEGMHFEKNTPKKIKNWKNKIIINKQYGTRSPSSKEIENMKNSELIEVFGIDAYMFLQSIDKYEKNMELEKELRLIQIKN